MARRADVAIRRVRVTLKLHRELLEEARSASGGSFSRFVGGLLLAHLEDRRRRLTEDLRAGYLAEAETDLEIARQYEAIDQETAVREVG